LILLLPLHLLLGITLCGSKIQPVSRTQQSNKWKIPANLSGLFKQNRHPERHPSQNTSVVKDDPGESISQMRQSLSHQRDNVYLPAPQPKSSYLTLDIPTARLIYSLGQHQITPK
jgi:hypothetical protein